MATTKFLVFVLLTLILPCEGYDCVGKGLEPFHRAVAALVGVEYSEMSSRTGTLYLYYSVIYYT